MLLPAGVKVPSAPAILVDGRCGGGRWRVLASALPNQDQAVSALTGGRPLDSLSPQMAALVVRLWLDEMVGSIDDFAVDTVLVAPAPDASAATDLPVSIPMRVADANWSAEILFSCETTLVVAALAARFVTAAPLRLPDNLYVAIDLGVGAVELTAADLAGLEIGDLIVLDTMAVENGA